MAVMLPVVSPCMWSSSQIRWLFYKYFCAVHVCGQAVRLDGCSINISVQSMMQAQVSNNLLNASGINLPPVFITGPSN